ncbi:MAG: serine/threonine-protein kinase [Isosphaeraceae bacterium]
MTIPCKPDDDKVGLEDWQQIIKIREEYAAACRLGESPRIEDHLGRVPDAARVLLRELIIADIEARRERGEQPTPSDYATRFLGDTPTIAEAFREAEESTADYPSRPGPGEPAPASSPPGSPFGPYEDQGEIGRGGMGAVHRVRDPILNRDLALKVIFAEADARPALRRRFLDEAQITSQLQHPGVPPIHECGTLPDGRPYYTMKLVKGRTLSELLKERPDPSTDLPRFLAIFEQVAQAIAYAHSKRVVHRDLKPANIMVGAFGEVQVMDWGLARLLGQPEPPGEADPEDSIVRTHGNGEGRLSRTGDTMGTPAYMAPEQALGQISRIDERTDVFALGSILCAILTGSPAYRGGSAQVLIARAARADLADALARLEACDTDPELKDLARTCLNPDPDARPRDGAAVAQQVAAYQELVRLRLHQAELAQVEAEARAEEEQKRRIVADELTREAQARAAAERSRRLRTVALAGSLVALAVLAGGAGLWWLRRIDADQQQADRLLAAAEGALDQARAADPKEEAPWNRADGQAQALREAIDRSSIGGRPKQRILDFLDRADRESRAARLDRELLAGLVRIRNLRQEVGEAGTLDSFRRWFRNYGVDDATDPAELGVRLGDRPEVIRIALASGLDEAAILVRSTAGGTDEWQSWIDLSSRIDPEPTRQELRQAWARKDTEQLKSLAQQPDRVGRLSPAAITLLARLVENDDRALSVSVLRDGVARHLHDLWINHDLAMLLEELGPEERTEAIGYYRVAQAIEPGTGHSLAHLLEARGRSTETEAVFRELVDRHEADARDLVCYGTYLLEKGLPANTLVDRAIRAACEAIRLRPDDAVAHHDHGNALELLGKTEEAVAAYREAIRLRPGLAEAYHNLGISLTKLDELQEATASYREAIRLAPGRAEFQGALSVALRRLGRSDEAISACQEAIKLKPDHWVAYNNLGIALAAQGMLDGAIEAFRDAIRLQPSHSDPYFNLGHALFDKGESEEAIASLRESIRLRPDKASAHDMLGNALAARGMLEEAIAAYRQAICLQPDDPISFNNLGVALARPRTA